MAFFRTGHSKRVAGEKRVIEEIRTSIDQRPAFAGLRRGKRSGALAEHVHSIAEIIPVRQQ
jgi:hypothetical protein